MRTPEPSVLGGPLPPCLCALAPEGRGASATWGDSSPTYATGLWGPKALRVWKSPWQKYGGLYHHNALPLLVSFKNSAGWRDQLLRFQGRNCGLKGAGSVSSSCPILQVK